MRKRSTIVALIAGLGAGFAAAGWLLRDRLLPSEEPEAQRRSAPEGPDDLTAITGIGPVYRERLTAAGIAAFDELIAAGPAAVAQVAQVAEAAAADWITQAAALHGAR